MPLFLMIVVLLVVPIYLLLIRGDGIARWFEVAKGIFLYIHHHHQPTSQGTIAPLGENR